MGISTKAHRFIVLRINDDGRSETKCTAATYENASLLAGAFRDASTEREISEGWNYLPASKCAKLGTQYRESNVRRNT